MQTPLDGTANFDLTAPQGSDYRMRVLAGTRVVMRARSNQPATGGYTVCGARTLTVKVTRAAGSGPFTVTATVP